METTEEKGLENRPREIIQSEEQKEKIMEKSEQNLKVGQNQHISHRCYSRPRRREKGEWG